MSSFYTDFAAAFGTLFLAVLALALLSQTHIQTGVFGLIGFPAIGVVYAFVRRPQRMEFREKHERLENEVARLKREVRELRKGSGLQDESSI